MSYILILLLTIAFPLFRSFESKLKFYKKWPIVIAAAVLVGIPFLIWDMIFTGWGVWEFSAEHILGFRIVGLPLEEILFFVAAPFSCIFIWESVKYFVKNKRLGFVQFVWIPAMLLLYIAATNSGLLYTFTVFSITSLFLFVMNVLNEEVIDSNRFLITMGFCFIGFVAINYLLTSIPVVSYDNLENLQIRVFTIPIEDFVYNFLLVAANIVVYEHILKYLNNKNK